MNILCALAGFFLFCFSAFSQAAVYQVTGTLDDTQVISPYFKMVLSTTPEKPRFENVWQIDALAMQFSGKMEFEPFLALNTLTLDDGSTGDSLTSNGGFVADMFFDEAVFHLDPLYRTLTITGVRSTHDGVGKCLYGTEINPCSELPPGAETANGTHLTLVLLFDENYSSFVGTGLEVSGDIASLQMTSYYSFSGTAVPIPAAIWLLGSGLLGLAVTARRSSKS